MFHLGYYYEDEIKPIVNYLKDAGMKVEQKASLFAVTDQVFFLEAKLSELKGEIKDFETYERYLAALETALTRGATPDDLQDRFYSELDPAYAEKLRLFREISENPAPLSDEEKEARSKKLEEITNSVKIDYILKMSDAHDFAITTLSRNEIMPDENPEARLSDPILRIKVNPEEYKDHKLLKWTIFIDLHKRYQLYIDEFSSTLYDELDEDFEDSYQEEYIKIKALGLLMNHLAEEQSPAKIDMKEFAERSDIEMEVKGNIIRVDGSGVGEEIARALEKNGVIKIKGNTIKWRAQIG